MESSENYVYKKTVDWSLLTDGVAIPLENQVIFGRNMGRFLRRGETRDITLFPDGKSYPAKINSLNLSEKHNRKTDILQIRYAPGGEPANALRVIFEKSYDFFVAKRAARDPGDRSMIRLPEGQEEYLAIYTTEYEDTYVLEAITRDAMNGEDKPHPIGVAFRSSFTKRADHGDPMSIGQTLPQFLCRMKRIAGVSKAVKRRRHFRPPGA
jgi:hypothetical protein